MKQIKIINIAILLAIVFTGFTACSSENDEKVEEGTNYKSLIIGKWKRIYESPTFHTHIEYKSNGTFSYTSTEDPRYEEHGEYKIDGDYLYEHFSDEPEDDWAIYKITLLNSMSLTIQYYNGELGSPRTYQRVN